MSPLRLVHDRRSPRGQEAPRRRSGDRLTEERSRYPAEEQWEVSCRLDDEGGQPSEPAPETRAS